MSRTHRTGSRIHTAEHPYSPLFTCALQAHTPFSQCPEKQSQCEMKNAAKPAGVWGHSSISSLYSFAFSFFHPPSPPSAPTFMAALGCITVRSQPSSHPHTHQQCQQRFMGWMWPAHPKGERATVIFPSGFANTSSKSPGSML